MQHKKHGAHPHDKMAAMPQFHEGHWEEKPGDSMTGGSRYAPEFGEKTMGKESVNKLASYVKSHRPKS